MKLLFDQNISYKLVSELEDLFPGSSHVRLLNLDKVGDDKIWQYAKSHNFVIITRDSDFNEKSLLYGYPPKVIWLQTGNISTKSIKTILRENYKNITNFEKDKSLGCLEIY